MGTISSTDPKTETLEEEGECGLCVFMKAGDCKDSVIAWEDCIKEAEKNKEDVFNKCMEVTSLLTQCMVQHSDYYKPILARLEAAEAEFRKELEAEKNKEEEASKMKGN